MAIAQEKHDFFHTDDAELPSEEALRQREHERRNTIQIEPSV